MVSHNLSDFPPLIDGRHQHMGIEYLTAIEFIEDALGFTLETVFDAEVPQADLLRSQRKIE